MASTNNNVSTTATCPGKVLILGGYAILERPNSGLVLAVDSRFRSSATWEDDVVEPGSDPKVEIFSKQWGGWKGSYRFSEKEGLVPDASSTERNAYVEKPASWALYCATREKPFPPNKSLKIVLLADNDFYSQQENLKALGLKRTSEGLRALPPFSEVRNKSAKTGLGSSAAMISSLVSCILAHVADNRDVEYSHRIAQLCHAAVQGKIGSGFDVCAAFYGSMRYVRYDADPLGPCLSTMSSKGSSFAAGAKDLHEYSKKDSAWNHVVEPSALPSGIELLCADVAGGSETPSMSKKILDWRSKSDGTVWNTLISRNDIARGALDALRQAARDASEYELTVNRLSTQKSSEWEPFNDVAKLFVACHKAFLNVRDSLRKVGELADVPVEPSEQQALCDATLSHVPGVLACGVPGAGGFDAVFALVLGKDAAKQLETFWENYSSSSGESKICPLLLRESKGNAGVLITVDVDVKRQKN